MPNANGVSLSILQLFRDAPFIVTIAADVALSWAVALRVVFDALVVGFATVVLSGFIVTVLDVVVAGSGTVLVEGSEVVDAMVGSAAVAAVVDAGSAAGS